MAGACDTDGTGAAQSPLAQSSICSVVPSRRTVGPATRFLPSRPAGNPQEARMGSRGAERWRTQSGKARQNEAEREAASPLMVELKTENGSEWRNGRTCHFQFLHGVANRPHRHASFNGLFPSAGFPMAPLFRWFLCVSPASGRSGRALCLIAAGFTSKRPRHDRR